MLHNWGGKMGMYGRINAVTKELPALIDEQQAGNLSGIGLTPEGLMTNPYIYDLMCEMVWQQDTVNVDSWTKKYIERRYGKESKKAEAAWKILTKTLYDCRDLRHGPQGAHYCMRPTANFSRGSFVRSELFYNPKDIREALKLLLDASSEIGDSEGYMYDLVDLTRQCLSDLSLDMHHQMSKAYVDNNYEEYTKVSNKWLSAILDLDVLLGTREEFLLGNWIESAKKWADNSSELNLYEWNARNLITLWGPGTSSLHDYAQKQWSGIMKDFYYTRWKMLIDEVKESMKNNHEFNQEGFNLKVSEFEERWTKENNIYETETQGNSLFEAKRIFEKYFESLCE